MVFTAASDAIRYPSPYDSSSATYYDDELQGIVHLPPSHNDTGCGFIREELECLIVSATVHETNMDQLLQIDVFDLLHTSYKMEKLVF